MRRSVAAAVVALAVCIPAPSAAAQSCRRVVVFALPGVTWGDVDRYRPPHLMRAVDSGAAGSVSVRTIAARSTYASGFATLGAGARVEADRTALGAPAGPSIEEDDNALARGVEAAGVTEMKALAAEAGYGSQPGALNEALDDVPVIALGNSDLGKPPPAPAGHGRWALLSAMDAEGRVDLSMTGDSILATTPGPFDVSTDRTRMETLIADALARPCVVLFVDPGDLARVDAAAAIGAAGDEDRARAIEAADGLLGVIAAELDPRHDLLLAVTPASALAEPQTHLGIAVVVGPGFRPGDTLESASTRRAGIVTLPDVAPTILAALDVDRPPQMNGRPWVGVRARQDPVQAGAALDSESVFLDRIDNPLSAAYVVIQVLVYAAAVWLFGRRRDPPRAVRGVDHAALAVMSFPVATYLAGALPADRLGVPGYIAVLVTMTVAIVAAAAFVDDLLDRVLVVTALTTLVIAADVMTGARLQINTIFGYSPIVAGRFAGIGNVAYAVLGVAALLTVALVAERTRASRPAVLGGAALLLLIVVVDGAPQFGSDVGGVLSLVPAFAITLLLLMGKRPRPVTIAAIAGAVLVLLGLFLVADLARPPSRQTHLARTWSDITERGWASLAQVVERKARANIRVFSSTIWTYFVPPALAALAFLLVKPVGRWQQLTRDHPRVRAGLVGGLTLAILGFAVNDSGIVIPAVTLSFLVPLAVVLHSSSLKPPETSP